MGKANRNQFETLTNKEKKIRAIINTLEDIDTIVDQHPIIQFYEMNSQLQDLPNGPNPSLPSGIYLELFLILLVSSICLVFLGKNK